MRSRSAGTGSLETKEDTRMRYKRAAAVIMAVGIMIMQASGNVYPAQETEAMEPASETAVLSTEAPVPETPAPQPETPAPEPETPTPQPETPAPEPETSAPQPEIPAPEPETSAPQPETAAPQTETAVPQTEMPAVQDASSKPSSDQAESASKTVVAENNHSTSIPENPTEERIDQEIVDAGEEDYGTEDPEDEDELERDPQGDSYSGGSSYSAGSFRDFRFTRVEKRPAAAKQDFSGFIRENADESSSAVGKIAPGGTVYLLARKGDWYFVESGAVRGFIHEKNLVIEESKADKENKDADSAADMAAGIMEAVSFCTPSENENYTYTYTTVYEVLAGKQEALMIGPGSIYEFADEGSRPVGTGASGCLVYVLSAGGNGWYFVESDDVRGFIRYENLVTGDTADVILENEGGAESLAKELVSPEENRSLYFTLLSVRETSTPAGNGLFMTGGNGIGYSQDQLELIWAIVAQEDNGSYEGALAVISSAVNRCESPTWGYLGSDPLSQLTAPGQYCYSLDDYWRPRLGGNVPDYVRQAVEDCLVRGIRNHTYTSFRSTKGKTTGNDAVQIGGNWFFGS